MLRIFHCMSWSYIRLVWSYSYVAVRCVLIAEFIYFIIGNETDPETENAQSGPPLRRRLIDRCDHISDEACISTLHPIVLQAYMYCCPFAVLTLLLEYERYMAGENANPHRALSVLTVLFIWAACSNLERWNLLNQSTEYVIPDKMCHLKSSEDTISK